MHAHQLMTSPIRENVKCNSWNKLISCSNMNSHTCLPDFSSIWEIAASGCAKGPICELTGELAGPTSIRRVCAAACSPDNKGVYPSSHYSHPINHQRIIRRRARCMSSHRRPQIDGWCFGKLFLSCGIVRTTIRLNSIINTISFERGPRSERFLGPLRARVKGSKLKLACARARTQDPIHPEDLFQGKFC